MEKAFGRARGIEQFNMENGGLLDKFDGLPQNMQGWVEAAFRQIHETDPQTRLAMAQHLVPFVRELMGNIEDASRHGSNVKTSEEEIVKYLTQTAERFAEQRRVN